MTIRWQVLDFMPTGVYPKPSSPILTQCFRATDQYLYSFNQTMDVEDFSEDQIWDAIKDNAKCKIDYAGFAALFPFDPDNFLSSIIYGFAVGRSNEIIADKISAQVFMTGNSIDSQALDLFIEGSQSLLKKEIEVTVKALQMLDDGAEPEEVYETVSRSLGL